MRPQATMIFALCMMLFGLLGCDNQKTAPTPKASAQETTPAATSLDVSLTDKNVRLFLPDGQRGLREYKTRKTIPAAQRSMVILMHTKHPLGAELYRVADLTEEKDTYPTTIIKQSKMAQYQHAVSTGAQVAESTVWDIEMASIYMGRKLPRSKRTRSRRASRRASRRQTKHGIRINSTSAQNIKTTRQTRYKPVTFYSAKWCGVCKRARRYLLAQRIPHKYIDIDKSRSGRDKFYALCRQSGKSRCPVPTFKIGGQTMFGWSARRFDRLARY